MTPNNIGQNTLSLVDIRLSTLGWRNVNWFLRAEFSLIAQIVSYICVNRTQSIQYGDSGRLKVNPLGLRSLKGFLVRHKQAKIASPNDLASHDEAGLALSDLALLL